jgi:hypothetical protein
MAKTVVVGAPSLTGGGVAQLLADALSGLQWPVEVTVENRFPFAFGIPEAGGLLLKQVADLEHCKGSGSIASMPALVRMLTNIESVAEAHRAPEAVILTFPGVLDGEVVEEPATEPPATSESIAEEPVTGTDPDGTQDTSAAVLGDQHQEGGADAGDGEKPAEDGSGAAAETKRRGRPPKAAAETK